jgi:hypothetical protein
MRFGNSLPAKIRNLTETKFMDQQTNSFLGTEEAPLYTPSSDEKSMGMLSHLLAIFFGFLAPLIIYLVKKDESKYVSEHAKESLNFQITLLIAYIVCFFLMFVLIGILLMVLLHLFRLVVCIIATIRANEGKMYRYPFTITLIK